MEEEMTLEEKYWADMEHQKEQDWQRFEEDKLNKPETKVIPFSIAYQDREVEATIIEKGA